MFSQYPEYLIVFRFGNGAVQDFRQAFLDQAVGDDDHVTDEKYGPEEIDDAGRFGVWQPECEHENPQNDDRCDCLGYSGGDLRGNDHRAFRLIGADEGYGK